MINRLPARTVYSGLIVAGVFVVFFLFLDRPISRAAYELKTTWIHDWAVGLSYLADHTVIFSFLTVGFTACAVNLTGSAPKEWARNLLYVCLSACIAIAFVECIKFIFGRCRPGLLFSEGRYGFTWLTQTYELHSFPSGHTTRIFALATAAAIAVRGLAIPCLAIAALVGISRVFALKHYPSDVLTGAYLGIIVAFWVFAVRKVKNK